MARDVTVSKPPAAPPLLSRELMVELTAALLALILLSGLMLWIRKPVTEIRGIQNEDVAGITYNADLLLRGKVPLVDNLEYKAPGAFYLTAFVFSVFGRTVKAHEYFGIFWSFLAMLGMFVGGRVLFGSLASGMVAAFLYVLCSPVSDSMTVNYNSWMIAPYVWATVLFLIGLKRGGLGWLVAAGIIAVIGALMKRQGAMIVPLFGLVLLAGPLLRAPAGWHPPTRWRGTLAFSAGVAIGFLPMSIYYLIHGGLGTFVGHYLGSSAGWEYVRGQEVDWSGKLDRLEDGVYGLFEYMALPTVLAAIAAASNTLRRDRGWTLIGVLLGGHVLMSFVGASLGFRFYKGYYLQILPAAAWLAASTEGPVLRWFQRGRWPDNAWQQSARVAQLLAVLLLCLPAALPVISKVKGQRRGRVLLNAYQYEAQKIAKVIKANTQKDEGIWVWGRWAWPIYFYADRISSTRYYKVLGLITTNLTNTWKRPTSMTRFVKKGPWREIGSDLLRDKPAFIVTANNESYAGFTPLQQLLQNEYDRLTEPRATAFKFWVRKDRQVVGISAKARIKTTPKAPVQARSPVTVRFKTPAKGPAKAGGPTRKGREERPTRFGPRRTRRRGFQFKDLRRRGATPRSTPAPHR